MSFPTIDALRESLARPTPKARTPEYVAKMMHAVPNVPVVEREKFILTRCAGQRVLEFGASGPLHDGIAKVAAFVYSSDKHAPHVTETVDLDDVSVQFVTADSAETVAPDVIVCGEVIEHLSNPGWFLKRLRRQYAGVPVIITVPNAFSRIAAKHLEDGIENVNLDHVCWYSYRTLRTLLERYGYEIDECYWYHGEPYTAEGLIVVTR